MPSEQPPAAFIHRRKAQAIHRRWWFQGQPKQLAHKLDRVPVDRSQHVEANDVEGQGAQDERGQAQAAQVDGADLCIANAAQQMQEKGLERALVLAVFNRHATLGGSGGLDSGE
jgi:hypothetical protein